MTYRTFARVAALAAGWRRKLGRALGSGVALAAAGLGGGCGISSLTSGLGGGVLGGGTPSGPAVNSVTEEQLLSAAKADEGAGGVIAAGEVAHGCPRFLVLPRDNTITVYEPGRVGDGLGIVHRGEILKTARECQVEPGRVTVKYGFSGRVLLGPRGKPGVVILPLNFAVTDAKRERIAGDTFKVSAPVSLDKPIGYFSAVKTVTFPIPEGTRPGEFEMFVGFDRKVANSG